MDIGRLVLIEHSYAARPPGNSLRESGPNLDETMADDDNMEPVEVIDDDIEVIEFTPPNYTRRPEVPVTRDPGEGNEGGLKIPWAKMRKITNQMEKYSSFIPFLKPVDPLKEDVLNYYDVIKRPMDLETISARIENKYYRSEMEWIEDFHLMFANCLDYNEDPDSHIRQTAGTALNLFADKLEENGLPEHERRNHVVTYPGTTRRMSKTNKDQEHLENNVTTIESSSSDSDVEFLEFVKVERSATIASSGEGSDDKKAGTSSSTISVVSSEDMRDMPNLQRIKEERTISFSSDGGHPPVLSPKLVKMESRSSSVGSSPKLQIVDHEQSSPSHSAEPDLVGDMDMGASISSSHDDEKSIPHEVDSRPKSSQTQRKKLVKTAKRRKRASCSVSSVSTTEAIAALPEEKNGIVTNGENTVTKSGRKAILTKRFTVCEPEVTVKLPPQLKYYKLFIDDMLHYGKLKSMFPNILPPRGRTPAKDCLQEIKRKFDLKKYTKPEELEEDVRLLLENKSNATGEKEAMDFERLEKGWNAIVNLWEPDLKFDNAEFCGLFPLEEDPLDLRKWTMVEIQDLLRKIDKLPLGKMANIFHIMRTKELSNCPSLPNRQLDMIARFGEFKPKSLNAIRKEADHILAVIEREKMKEAADRARVERKLKQREAKSTKETPPEEDIVGANVSALPDSKAPSSSSSSSGSSSDSDSSSGSGSSSSSSDAETESEDEAPSGPAKLKKKIKSMPKKIYTNNIVLSENDSSDDEDSRLPRIKPLVRETEASKKAISASSSGALGSNAAVPNSSKRDSQASSTVQAPDTLPQKKIRVSSTEYLTEVNEHRSAPPQKPVQSTISFGIITIPVEAPGHSTTKKLDDEEEPKEFPELSNERKAMREEAALLRRKQAINIDPIKMEKLVDLFNTCLAYVGGEVYVREASVLDILQIGCSPREPDQHEDYLQDIPMEQPKKRSIDEPRKHSSNSSLAENVKYAPSITPKVVPMDTELTKRSGTDSISSLRYDQNLNDVAEFTEDAKNLKHVSLKSSKAVSPMEFEPTKVADIESVREDQKNNVGEDSGDEIDMDALDFEDC